MRRTLNRMSARPAVFAAWLGLVLAALPARAQLSVVPALPGPDDTVTVTFDATRGNGALMGYPGPVYAHTGVLTPASTDSSDWRYVATAWGTPDSVARMVPDGPDRWTLRLVPRAYYGLPPGEIPTDLGFLFRNADASLVARDTDGSDMFWPMGFEHASGSYAGHAFDGVTLTVFGSAGPPIALRAFGEATLQLAARPDTSLPWATTASVVGLPVPATLLEDSLRLVLDAGLLRAEIRKADRRVSFLRGTDTLLRTDLTPTGGPGTAGQMRLAMRPNERWQGAGSRAIASNRTGRTLSVYNTQSYGYGFGAETMNIATPFALSERGYGVYWDHRGPATWQLGSADPGRMTYATEMDGPGLFVFGGIDYDASLEAYHRLTGFAPLPPRWALGYIQSKYGYRHAASALGTVEDLLDGGFPLDALVLDLYWFGGPGRMGDFDWHAPDFPDPTGLVQALRERGVGTVLITEPYVTTASDFYAFLDDRGWLARDLTGETYVLGGFWTGPAALLDLTADSAADWLSERYADLLADDLAGWWCDLGEPETHPWDMIHAEGSARWVHNRYSLRWAALLDGLYRERRPGERLFNLIRSGFAGMQRYGTYPWSGDVQRSWSGLQAQVPVMTGMGMSGQAWMHHDAGGFTGGFDAERYLRWMQLGTFSPVFRAHGVDDAITEPVYLAEPFRSLARRAVRERYRWLPYNYTLAWRYARTGRPLLLPMDYFHPGDPGLVDRDDQAYWGADVVIAPIQEAGSAARAVALPPGRWINGRDGTLFEGPGNLTAEAPLGWMPRFLRAGSVIPMAWPGLANAGRWTGDSIIWTIWSGTQADPLSGEVYLDDGYTRAADSLNVHEHWTASGAFDADGAWLDLSRTGGGSWSGAAARRLQVLHWRRIGAAPMAVTRDGIPLPVHADSVAWALAGEGWWHDVSRSAVWVAFSHDGSLTRVRLEGARSGQPAAPDLALSTAAWPNPFTESLQWRVEGLAPGPVRLSLVGADGRIWRTWTERAGPDGTVLGSVDASGMPTGACWLEWRQGSVGRRMALVRMMP